VFKIYSEVWEVIEASPTMLVVRAYKTESDYVRGNYVWQGSVTLRNIVDKVRDGDILLKKEKKERS